MFYTSIDGKRPMLGSETRKGAVSKALSDARRGAEISFYLDSEGKQQDPISFNMLQKRLGNQIEAEPTEVDVEFHNVLVTLALLAREAAGTIRKRDLTIPEAEALQTQIDAASRYLNS